MSFAHLATSLYESEMTAFVSVSKNVKEHVYPPVDGLQLKKKKKKKGKGTLASY